MGEVVHKGKAYPGEHEAIVSKGLWEKVQAILSENTRAKQTRAQTKLISPLQGVVRCGHCDGAMGLTYTQKGPRRYTYYHCAKDAKRERLLKRKERLEDDFLKVRARALEEAPPDGDGSDPGPTLVELNQEAVTLSRRLTDVSARAQAFESDPVAEREVAEAFQSVETFWEDLFPLERNRLIRLLVEKVEVRETGIDLELKTRGLSSLIIELSGLASEARERSNGR